MGKLAIYRIKLIVGICMLLSVSACSTVQIKPAAGDINSNRIEPLNLNNIKLAVHYEPGKVVYKHSALFDTTYIVTADSVGLACVRLLKKQLAVYGGRITSSTHAKPDKQLTIQIHNLDYLGPVSLSFHASAWMSVTILLGDGKSTTFRTKYTTPRSMSLNETFLQQAFDGLVREAVIKTLNDREIRAYLASGP
jgi:hypothetical protein